MALREQTGLTENKQQNSNFKFNCTVNYIKCKLPEV